VVWGGTVNSCVYEGTVRHRRFEPVSHAFSYPLFMMYLDLDELPAVLDCHALWSARRPAPAWFRRADYLGRPEVPLDEAVRALVAERVGRRPEGPIRLLTHLRYFGYIMNPVSFYYCFDLGGDLVETIVAEVTNTPWNERHSYVLGREADEGGARVHRYRLAKEFHVSPFMDMDLSYDWRFSQPARRLVVHMKNLGTSGKMFDATLVMRRQELSRGTLSRMLMRYPWITARVISAIYWQALRLCMKGAPFYTHPAKRKQ